MAGPWSIQRSPSGLLGALGLRGTGRNPESLQPVVVPTFNVEPYYIARDLASVAISLPAQSVAGALLDLPVPDGQAWRVMSASVSLDTFSAAGAVVQLAIQIRPSGGFGVTVNSMNEPVTITSTNQLFRIAGVLPQPLVLAAGSSLRGLMLEDTASGNATLGVQALVQVLQL